MLQKLLIFLCFFVFGIPILCNAQNEPVQQLTQYLNAHYPPVYQILSQITEKHQNRLVFTGDETTVSRGQELLVLEQQADVPDYLLPQSAVIRIESMFQDKILAQQMAQLGSPIHIGDPVARPASPIVYLYTNVKGKDSFPPYQELLQSLLNEDYEVVEVFQDQIQQHTDRYGVLVRLDSSKDHLTSKIQSLYSGDTFFSRSWEYLKPVTTLASAGKPITLAKRPQPRETTPSVKTQRPKTQKPSFMETEPEGELAYSLSENFTQAPSFMKAKPSPERKIFRLRKGYRRFITCNLNSDNLLDFVFLSNKRIDAYSFDGVNLTSLASFAFPKKQIIGIHLHSLDITHDTRDEVVVTLGHEGQYAGAPDTELQSLILTFTNNHFQILAKDLPYYLRVIEDWTGKSILIGQKKGAYLPYTGDIVRFTWSPNSKTFSIEDPYRPAHDIYSVYQFNFVSGRQDYVMILEPSNFVSVYYTPDERMQAITDRNYGSFTSIPYKIKLEEPEYMGDYEHKKLSENFYAPRRFLMKTRYDGQAFLIRKERGEPSLTPKIKNVVLRENGEDSLTALKWSGDYIRQSWQSKKLPKNIIDFQFYSSDEKDHIFVLVRDNQGFALERLQ
jgi:hypothetical protein